MLSRLAQRSSSQGMRLPLSRLPPACSSVPLLHSHHSARSRQAQFQTLFSRAFAEQAASGPVRTALYDMHVKHKGKIVDFAGYALPVQYGDALGASHLHCRSSASLFDVSHMGQVLITGAAREAFIESVTVADVQALAMGQSRLSVITNDDAGILDDCMVTRKEDHVYLVINAGCKDKDLAHLQQRLKLFNQQHNADVEMNLLERSLVALQGPLAHAVLGKLLPADVDLAGVDFTFSFTSSIGAVSDCWISRCGYTGEDGFEISVSNDQVEALWSLLLEDEMCLPCGLAVRDSLRLEAGLCLYGHDLNETITPNEAGLLWTITKRRRAEGGFPGHARVMQQIKDKVTRKRVGLKILKGAPAREGAEILTEDGSEVIGTVTSGTLSPILKEKIAMGYLSGPSKAGTKVAVRVRGKVSPAEISKMPFVPAKYYKKP